MKKTQLDILLQDFRTQTQITEDIILNTQELFNEVSDLKKQIIFNNKHIDPNIINLLVSNEKKNYYFLIKFSNVIDFIKNDNKGYLPNANSKNLEEKQYGGFINRVLSKKNNETPFKKNQRKILLKFLENETHNIKLLEKEKQDIYLDKFNKLKKFILENKGSTPSKNFKEQKEIAIFYRYMLENKDKPAINNWYKIKKEEFFNFIDNNTTGLSYGNLKRKEKFEKQFKLLKEFVNNHNGYLPSNTKEDINQKKLNAWVTDTLNVDSNKEFRFILEKFLKEETKNKKFAAEDNFETMFKEFKKFTEENDGYLPLSTINNTREYKLSAWLKTYYDKTKELELNENTDPKILQINEYIILHTRKETKQNNKLQNDFNTNFQKFQNFVNKNKGYLPQRSKTNKEEFEAAIWLYYYYTNRINDIDNIDNIEDLNIKENLLKIDNFIKKETNQITIADKEFYDNFIKIKDFSEKNDGYLPKSRSKTQTEEENKLGRWVANYIHCLKKKKPSKYTKKEKIVIDFLINETKLKTITLKSKKIIDDFTR